MTADSVAVIVLLALFAVVATFGSREDGGWRKAALENGGFVAFFALAQRFGFGMLPVVEFVFLPVFVAVRFPSFLRGWNYVCVAHPAAPIVRPARRGKSVDVEGLANVLVKGAHHSGFEETYHYEHQAEKARALAEKLNAEAAVTEARAERERRRAELADAKRYLEDARRRSEDTR